MEEALPVLALAVAAPPAFVDLLNPRYHVLRLEGDLVRIPRLPPAQPLLSRLSYSG